MVQELGGRDLLLVELPRRDLFLDRAAEERRLGQTVDGEQLLELREFERADPLARLERADRLLSDAGYARHIFLSQSAHAADFTKFQYEIHLAPPHQNRRISPDRKSTRLN